MLWASKGPVSTAWINGELGEESEWKPTTVLTFLSRLVEKGFLQVEKNGKSNLYTARISLEEYKRRETKSFLNQVHGGSVKSFMAALCDDPELSGEELEELKSWFSSEADRVRMRGTDR